MALGMPDGSVTITYQGAFPFMEKQNLDDQIALLGEVIEYFSVPPSKSE